MLDLTYGRGRVAAHITTISGSQVTGINIDPNQIGQAIVFNKEKGFNNRFVIQASTAYRCNLQTDNSTQSIKYRSLVSARS